MFLEVTFNYEYTECGIFMQKMGTTAYISDGDTDLLVLIAKD